MPPAVQPSVKLLIDGQFVESSTKDWVAVVNPVRVLCPPQEEFTCPRPDPGLEPLQQLPTASLTLSGRRT